MLIALSRAKLDESHSRVPTARRNAVKLFSVGGIAICLTQQS